MNEAKIIRINRGNGLPTIRGAYVKQGAPEIAGFLPLRLPDMRSDCTVYVNIDTIESFVVDDADANDVRFAFPRQIVDVSREF